MVDCATAYTLDFILRSLPPNSRRVLEIGCGDGAVAAALLGQGVDVVALDSDPNAVSAARARGVRTVLAEWPLELTERFDAVLFTRSLHHLCDLAGGILMAFQCLSPGGRVIVEDFRAEGSDARSDAWFGSFASLLRQAGLLNDPPDFSRGYPATTGDVPATDHDLHPSHAIAAELRHHGANLDCEGAAYYFRYLLPALAASADWGEAVLKHEVALISAGVIEPLGRRFVAVSNSL